MTRARALLLAALLVLFLAVAAFLVLPRASSTGSRTVTVKVTGSSMQPATITARQGENLTVDVTADKAEIHLHGYDKRFEGKPGQTASQTFKADKPGSFDIEIEDSGTHLGDLEVSP